MALVIQIIVSRVVISGNRISRFRVIGGPEVGQCASYSTPTENIGTMIPTGLWVFG